MTASSSHLARADEEREVLAFDTGEFGNRFGGLAVQASDEDTREPEYHEPNSKTARSSLLQAKNGNTFYSLFSCHQKNRPSSPNHDR